MSSEPSPVPPTTFEVSPAAWTTIGQVAFAGRIVLLGAALFSLLATFIDHYGPGAFTKFVLLVLALGMAASAVFGLVKANRPADLAATGLALILVGSWGYAAFLGIGQEYASDLRVLPALAWILALGGGLAVGTALIPGPVAVSPVSFAPSTAGGSAPTAAWSPPSASSSTVAPAVAAPPAAVPAADSPVAGWYPAPDGVHARWWDGSTWTGDRRLLSDFDEHTTASS